MIKNPTPLDNWQAERWGKPLERDALSVYGTQSQNTVTVDSSSIHNLGFYFQDISFASGSVGGQLASIKDEDALVSSNYNTSIMEGISRWPDTIDEQGIQEECSFVKDSFTLKTESFFSKNNELKRWALYSILARFHEPGKPELGVEWLRFLVEKIPGFDESGFDADVAIATASGPRYCQSIMDTCGWKKCIECPHFRKVKSPIQIQTEDFPATENTGFYEVRKSEKGIPIRGRPSYVDLYKKYKRTNPYISVGGNIYTYNGMYWEIQENQRVKNFAEAHFNPPPSENMRREFFNKVAVNQLKARDWFHESTEGLINLQNGVFNVQTRELKPHSTDYGFQYVLPYAYDPNAQGLVFQEFLDAVTQGDKELQFSIIEFLGYAISNAECKAEKAMFLYGPTASNGKSTLIRAMQDLVGKKNYSSLTLEALNKDTKRLLLERALFNISEETNVRALSDSEIFKAMVTGGEIDVKQLYVQDYSIRNRTKLIIACNDMPKSGDRTDGLYRRILLIPMKARFDDEIGNRIPDMDLKLKKDLPGIFNLCVQGFERLLENNWQFTKAESSKKALDDYKRENDNVIQFLQDFLVWNPTDKPGFIFKTDIYRKYISFCDQEGFKFKATSQQFFKTLYQVYPKAEEKRMQQGLKRELSILNVEWIAE
jgi:putative DNA primase/helicase